jgi:hypothetical protein
MINHDINTMYRTEIRKKRSIYDDKMHNSLVTVIVF